MDVWIEVALVAVGVYLFVKFFEWKYREREKMEEIKKKLKKAKKEDGTLDEDLLREATTEMNKILLRRIVISIPLLIPLLWVMGLGTIETPIGSMNAVWWYFIAYIVVGGGVWLGSALQKAIKAGGRKNPRR